jgi:hypothetical protein
VSSDTLCFVRLYASDADHKPTGAILSQGMFNPSSLNLITYTWRDISMTPYNMVAGTKYCLVIFSTTDSNVLKWSICSNATVPGSASYSGGFCTYSTSSGLVWASFSGTDQLFEIFGSSSATENKVWYGAYWNLTSWTPFANWSGAYNGTSNWHHSPFMPNWTGAYYNWTKYQLTVLIEGNGFVTIVPDQTWYSEGDIVNLTAIPFVLCAFDHWDGDLAGNANPDTVQFTLGGGDLTVIANFSGSTFTYTDNDTDIPGIDDIIDPNTGLFNWARIFTIAWYYVFGGWFIAIILGIIGGALWITHKETPAVTISASSPVICCCLALLNIKLSA